MATCIVLPLRYVRIEDISANGKISDIWSWDESEAQDSTIGIEGDIQYRPDLRKSKSIRDRYMIDNIPEIFNNYFTQLCIGIGSKHIYSKGSFMKEHYDTRREDKEQLPHIMTLIVTNRDGLANLKVNGNFVKAPTLPGSDNYNDLFGVLFSLNYPHEVTEVTSTWKSRVSFTFPVYGTYDPTAAQSKALKNIESSTNQYSYILNVVERYLNMKDYNTEDIAKLHGYLKIIECDDIDSLMIKLKNCANGYGSHYEEDNFDYSDFQCFFKISYECTDNDAKATTIITSDLVEISEAKNIKIEPFDFLHNILLNIKKIIKKMEQDDLSHYNDIIYSDNSEKLQQISIPNEPFFIQLAGRYFTDSQIKDLLPLDKCIYEKIISESRKVSFYPMFQIQDEDDFRQSVPLYTVSVPHKALIRWSRTSVDSIVSDVEIEFDDGSEYNPKYKLVSAVLFVE